MSVRVSGPPPDVRGSRVDVGRLKRCAQGVLRALSLTGAELSLALIDDPEMQQLNASYRGLDRPTDVLSFSLVAGEGAEHRGALLGDVVISVETAASQARARHRGLDDEMARLLIHGMLHLIGHDHESPQEAQRMRAEERRVWRLVRR